MDDADAFSGASFLGPARTAGRDPYRLSLFARHFESGEGALALLPVKGGTLVVTDRRILEFQAHLEVHGAWNVREFIGYEIRRSVDRSAVLDVRHDIRSARDGPSAHVVEDIVEIVTRDGREDVLVSRGPVPSLSERDFASLRTTILGAQAK